MKKKPRFFCDNCGYEVGSDVKSCPYCGRFFASVRCPACDFSGPDKMFFNGCPMCGYSASPPPKTPKVRPFKERKKMPSAEPLSLIVIVIVLLVFVALLSYLITR